MRLVFAGLRNELEAVIHSLGEDLVKKLRFVTSPVEHYAAGDVRIIPLSYHVEVAELRTAAAFKRWRRPSEVFIVATGSWVGKLQEPRAFEPDTLIIDDELIALHGNGKVVGVEPLSFIDEVADLKRAHPKVVATANWPGTAAARMWMRAGRPGRLRFFVAPSTKAGAGVPVNHMRRHTDACWRLGEAVAKGLETNDEEGRRAPSQARRRSKGKVPARRRSGARAG